MLLHTFGIFLILILSYGESKSLENDSIFCKHVDTPLDFDVVVGTWEMVASIEAADKPNNNRSELYTCITSEFTGIVRETSKDFILKVEGMETFFLKDVEGIDGFKTTSGCYQKVKSLDDDVLDVFSAKHLDLMMMQFHLVESTELLLVQNVWHTGIPGRIALVYTKNTDKSLSEEDLQPALELVTKLRGKPQVLDFCYNDSDVNEVPSISKNDM